MCKYWQAALTWCVWYKWQDESCDLVGGKFYKQDCPTRGENLKELKDDRGLRKSD